MLTLNKNKRINLDREGKKNNQRMVGIYKKVLMTEKKKVVDQSFYISCKKWV